jgi:MoxR-like ATPase
MREAPLVARATPNIVERPSAQRRGLFHRAPPATPRSLLRDLREGAQLRLKRVDGKPFAALLEREAIILVPVPSREFFQAVDSFRSLRKEPPVPEKVALGLSALVADIVLAPGFSDELPLGGRGKNWNERGSILERELVDPSPDDPEGVPRIPPAPLLADAPLSLDLESLKIRERPSYHARAIEGLADLEILERAFENRHNVLIEGPPGCGKSLVTRVLAFELGLPYVRIDLHDGAEADDLIGKYVRIAGEWRWRDGRLASLVKHGGIFVADEINAGRAEMLTRIHALLDSRILTIPEHEGEAIEANEAFLFVGTMNSSGDGSRPLTARARDRFRCILEFDYDEEVEERLCPDPAILRAFRTLRVDPTIRTPVSTRLLVGYIENRDVYGPAVARRLLLNIFREAERPTVEKTVEAIAFREASVRSGTLKDRESIGVRR